MKKPTDCRKKSNAAPEKIGNGTTETTTQTKEEYNMTKYLISAAVAALMSMPVMAETVKPGDCVVVDHGGYKAFARGCEKLNGTNGRDREVDSEDTDGDGGKGGDGGEGDSGESGDE